VAIPTTIQRTGRMHLIRIIASCFRTLIPAPALGLTGTCCCPGRAAQATAATTAQALSLWTEPATILSSRQSMMRSISSDQVAAVARKVGKGYEVVVANVSDDDRNQDVTIRIGDTEKQISLKKLEIKKLTF